MGIFENIKNYVLLSGNLNNRKDFVTDQALFFQDLLEELGLENREQLKNYQGVSELVEASGPLAYHYYTIVDDDLHASAGTGLNPKSSNIFVGFTENEGSFESSLSQISTEEKLKELIDFETEIYQHHINNNRVKYATFIEYSSQGPTRQERKLPDYYPKWAVQYFGDAYYGSSMIKYLNQVENKFLIERNEKIFPSLFIHNVECENGQFFTENGTFPEKSILGQPARSIAFQLWDSQLEGEYDRKCNSVSNTRTIRTIISDIIHDDLPENYPKWSSEQEIYATTFLAETNNKNYETALDLAAYWPYRRPNDYWNRIMDIIDQPNSCMENKPVDTENLYPEATVTYPGTNQKVTYVGQKVTEFGRHGLNTWYGIKYGSFNERFEKIGDVDFQSENLESDKPIRANQQGLACPQSGLGFVNGLQIENCFTIDIFKSINDGSTEQQHNSTIIYFGDGANTKWNTLNNADKDNNFVGNSVDSWMGYLAEDSNGGTVVVKVNYRTGMLANLGGRNLGLDDAKKAFEFIVKNIQHFGGDSNKITIMGDGVGAVTASILSTKYPENVKNLVLQGGTFSSPWAFTEDPQKSLNCVLDNVYEAENIDDLKEIYLPLLMGTGVGCQPYPFGFYVDGNSENSNLPVHPYGWLVEQKNQNNNIPFAVISGFNQMQGYDAAAEKNIRINKNGFVFKLSDETLNEYISENIFGHASNGHENTNGIFGRPKFTKDMIFDKYYPFSLSDNNNLFQRAIRQNIIQMITDEGYLYPAIKDLKTINQQNTWLYQFNPGHQESRKIFNGVPNWVSAKDGEHNFYTFKTNSGRDVELSNTFMAFVSNFAQYSDPTIIGTVEPCQLFGWRNYNKDESSTALVFEKSRFRDSNMVRNFGEEIFRFWDSVYKIEEELIKEGDDDDVVTTELPVTEPVTKSSSHRSSPQIFSILAFISALFLILK